MKLFKPKQLQDSGIFMWLYGDSGVGKSTSVLQSSPQPMLYIMGERRNPKRFLHAAGLDESADIDFTFYDTVGEFIEFLGNHKNLERYKSVVVDGVTHLMNVQLASEIAGEALDARMADKNKKVDRPLIEGSKLSLEGYGSLSNLMFRIMTLLGKLSDEAGKVVVLISLLQENPRWNRDLEAGPCLAGKDFGKNMPGFPDLIGVVRRQFVLDEKTGEKVTVYPPNVSFEGDGFLCKWTGAPLKAKAGPLNVQKIVDLTKQSTNGGNAV